MARNSKHQRRVSKSMRDREIEREWVSIQLFHASMPKFSAQPVGSSLKEVRKRATPTSS